MRFHGIQQIPGRRPVRRRLLAEITNWTGLSADQGQQDDITLLLFDFKTPVRIPTLAEVKSSFGHDVSNDGLCHPSGSVQTTEKYLGCKQRLREAVNDKIGIEPGP